MTCKYCEYFLVNESLKKPYGECGAVSYLPDGDALVFPLGYETEGIAVHEDFGCVQFQPKSANQQPQCTAIMARRRCTRPAGHVSFHYYAEPAD